ncbi:MAG: prolyl oligopeptidase family serine peptidase [Deltaproteobacteria bacterium]|nr:prolyl oligopeptidase family serine peptidase [Deltaproteobacteria bacterium]
MMNNIRLKLICSSVILLLFVANAWSQETRMVPVNIDGETVKLEMRIYKPSGLGPFPTLVFNHGSTGGGKDLSKIKASIRYTTIANYFVKRGWAVVVPARRGRSASEGTYDEGYGFFRMFGYTCEATRSVNGADRALKDIRAAIESITSMAFVDASRITIGGQSRGGILSVAYAGQHPNQIQGVINFVGGWIGTGCDTAEQVNQGLFRRGSTYPKDTLWLYGKNDRYYSLAHSHKNFEAFKIAGGKGRFHEIETPTGFNGHRIKSLPNNWSHLVEEYLKEIGLPYKEDPTIKAIFEWPGFQTNLMPADSNSTVKAALTTTALMPLNPDITAEKRAFGGIWEGWMCRNATHDSKVAVFYLNNESASVEYASGSESRGSYSAIITAEFDTYGLKGKLPYGADLILGMRSDGNMNIMIKHKSIWCSGVLKQKQIPPVWKN